MMKFTPVLLTEEKRISFKMLVITDDYVPAFKLSDKIRIGLLFDHFYSVAYKAHIDPPSMFYSVVSNWL